MGTYRYTAGRYTRSPAWQGALGVVGGTGGKVVVTVRLRVVFTLQRTNFTVLCRQPFEVSVRSARYKYWAYITCKSEYQSKPL